MSFSIHSALIARSWRVAVVMFSVCASSGSLAGAWMAQVPSGEAEHKPSMSPFVWFEELPMDVDAAVVFNNPAEQFLLKDSVRSLSKLLAFSGIFTQSEHAWDALGDAFDADTDETIRSLLSARVVVVWDRIGSSSRSVFELADAVDTHWTLISEVDASYLDEIRTHLKPVRRRIEQGHAVYAIEQGRYEIVLLDRQAKAPGQSLVLIAPRKGAPLLDHVLASIAGATQEPGADAQRGVGVHSSLMDKRHELASSLQEHLDYDQDWSLAWLVQLDRIIDLPDPIAQTQEERSGVIIGEPPNSPALLGVLSATKQGVRVSFATDLAINLPTTDAPVGMLSAVGGDAIMALALAQTPDLLTDGDSGVLSSAFHLSSSPEDQSTDDGDKKSEAARFLAGPGIFLLKETPDAPANSKFSATLSVMAQLNTDARPGQSTAERVDGIMHELFSSIEPGSAPRFDGRFPEAIRTHTIGLDTQSEDQPKNTRSWPGQHPRVSWVSIETPGRALMIVSISPDGVENAKETRWVQEASQKFYSIPGDHDGGGVIASGYLSPSKMISMLDSSSAIDLALSRLIDRVDFEITRAPFGVRGTGSIKLADFGSLSKLGNDLSE